MCYDIQQMGDKIRRQAERQLGVEKVDFGQMEFQFFHVSGFSHPSVLAVTSDQPRLLHPLRWGLIPSWVRTPEEASRISLQTLNARNDGVFSKPSFRSAIRQRRCLIPVNGFFESREINGKKFPYFIHPPDDNVFWLGGIWENYVDPSTGEVLQTCSIITTEANDFMAHIHNVKLRMPLVLPEAALALWLDTSLPAEDIQSLMTPYSGEMQAHTVSRLVHRKRDNTNIPEVAQAFRYPELEYIDGQ